MAITTNKSVTLKASATGGTFTLNAKLTENSVNVSNNTSNVTVVATLSKGTGTFQGTGGTLYIDWYDNNTNTITQKGSKGISSLTSGSINVSATFDVSHLNNGTLSGYARARWVRGSSTYAPSSGNVSTNTTALTNIPRNSSLSLSGLEYNGEGKNVFCIIGKELFVNISNPEYTNKLYYSWNSSNITLLNNNITKNIYISFNGATTKQGYDNVTFPYTFKQIASTLPNNLTTPITFYLKTFNGDTQIGETSSVVYDYQIGEVYPINAVATLSTTDSLSKTLTGNTNTFINGISTIKNTITEVDLEGTGTIKSYNFVGNGENKTTTSSSYTFTNKVNFINNEFNTFYTTNRGLSGTLPTRLLTEYVLKDYTRPTITSTIIKRYDATSTTVNVEINGTYWNKSFGSVTNALNSISIKCTPSSGSASTKNATITYSGATYKGTASFTVATTSDAQFEIVVTDKASSISQIGNVTKAIAPFEFGDDYFGMYTDLYLDNKQVKGMKAPTANTDGANKKYVDDKASSSVTTATSNAKTYTDTEVGKVSPQNGVLWSGALWPSNTQGVTFSKKLSECQHGIILHWQGYSNNTLQNYEHTYQYIPKQHAVSSNGEGIFCSMGYNGGIRGYKYVYVNDDGLSGHANNSGTHTLSGVSYNNSLYVLSEVIEY